MVDRYKITLVNTNDGHLVKYGDYQRLESEVASLKQQLSLLNSATPSYVAGLEERIKELETDSDTLCAKNISLLSLCDQMAKNSTDLRLAFLDLYKRFDAAITTFS